MLGITVDPRYVARLERTHQERVRAHAEVRASRKAAAEAQRRELEDDLDWTLAFVAGRTSAGFPYGLTSEELEALGEDDELI